ncbi:MAG: hypothetical protein HQM09_23685 [Candidatus Riflebacteria bacterium]|nr:hypothetical protein [Candidatus Riflebacteria bacterium]
MKKMIMVFLIAAFSFAHGLWACAASGPSDPYTGMITYPNSQGPTGAQTVVPTAGFENTPFAGGKIYKGWSGSDAKFIIVPCGTQMGFEGIIISDKPLTPPRPAFWEEGAACVPQLNGSTVESAPKPTWTISGNGGGDYRGGPAPQAAPTFTLKSFEGPDDPTPNNGAGCMIVVNSPATKAVWKLTWDKATAVNMIHLALSDPVNALLVQKAFTDHGISGDPAEYLADPGNPELYSDAELYAGTGDCEISASKLGIDVTTHEADAAVAIIGALNAKLRMRSGDTASEAAQPTDFTDTGSGHVTFTRPVSRRVHVILKAGYIAMQDWYPSGNYSTKFKMTPPGVAISSPGATLNAGEYLIEGSPRTEMTFNTPTSPDFWTVDVQSGLESCKDCVWCWVEGTKLVDTATPVSSSSFNPSYTWSTDPADFAVGGVMVHGNYQSGNSSAGRDYQTMVVVADTRPPAKFEWLNTLSLKGETGKLLKDTQDAGVSKLTFRVYDDNPLIGAGTFKKLKNNLGTGVSFSDIKIIEADKKTTGGADFSSAIDRYLVPCQDGFDAVVLGASLTYNVCVPAYVGLKTSVAEATPFPTLGGRVVVPAQKFVWKTINASGAGLITNRMMYKPGSTAGIPSGDVKDLINGMSWDGYSSYDVEIPLDQLTEPMGTNFAKNSAAYTVPFGDSTKGSFVAPSPLPTDGTPVFADGIKFYPWSEKALKMFPSARDGSGNETPDKTQCDQIAASKYSGVELPGDDIGSWTESEITPPAAVNTIQGGPLNATTPAGKWGQFLYVKAVIDSGKPNIALEVLNTKNHKAAIYGDLRAGDGQSARYWTAFDNANAGSAVVSSDTNIGEKGYTTSDSEAADTQWEFSNIPAGDIYLPFQDAVEAGKFSPWLTSVMAPTPLSTTVGPYWNNDPATADHLAYHQDSRVPLVFRYWTWDNINAFNCGDAAKPNGVKIQSANAKFVDVNNNVTALITLVDQPTYPSGNVPEAQFWREYAFFNPNDTGECSIKLESEDNAQADSGAPTNNKRVLKVNFKIHAPNLEQIRTLEDKRERK